MCSLGKSPVFYESETITPMALGLKYYFDEARYHVHRTVRWAQGKALHVSLRTAMGGGAAAVATKLSYPVRDVMNIAQPTVGGAQAALTTGEILMSSTGGLLSIGLGAGINGYINHLEYTHNERQLCELYRPQIASIIGKEPALVTKKDLYAVAEQNPSLNEELRRNRRDRNIKNAAAVAGTVVAFGAVFAAVALVPAIGGLAAAAAAGGLLSASGLGFAALAGGIGYASLQASRRVIDGVGRKLLGLNEPSVEDKIRDLSKQHRKEHLVAPEQVVDVHLTANPDLAKAVEAQYGKPFNKLSLSDRRVVLQQYDAQIGATETANAINEGRMNVRELTFKVHGQFSGVYPEEPWQDKLKELAQERLDPLQHKIESFRDETVDKFQQWRVNREQSKLQDDVAKAIEEGKPLPKKAEEIGNETYWRNMINNQRAAEKGAEGPARA